MCRCYKSVGEIIKDTPNLKEYLHEADKYYAHTPTSNSKGMKSETLTEHTALVTNYFCNLVEAHHLDDVIDCLITSYLKDSNRENNSLLFEFIKQLFVNSVVFHDFGKVNENFQANSLKMNNPFFKGKEIKNSPISTYHSSLGAFIFVCKHLEDVKNSITPKDSDIAIMSVLLFSYPILKHHSHQLPDDYEEFISFGGEKVVQFLKNYLSPFGFVIDENVLSQISNTKSIFGHDFFSSVINSFSLYSLLRLNYSLLTAADYLATNEYMSGIPTYNLGLLSEKKINSIYQHITESVWLNEKEQKRNYNKVTYELLNSNNYQFKRPKEKSAGNLNVLRTEMSLDVIRTIRNNIDKNLFYIEAPTGGGKTNLSLLATIELLKHNKGKLNKVFYVFPFITLITQTYSSIKEVFGITDSDIVEVHSKAGIKNKTDDLYGAEKQNLIDYLFLNFPISLLTHIKFFDIVKTNIKEQNYLLHRLANSVIVIDELQSYNPKHWDKVIYFIKQYAEMYNIKFILMSATLPKLDKLNILKDKMPDFVYLLPDAKDNYFRNPNFGDRVTFNFDLCNNKTDLETIWDKLLFESELYAQKDFGTPKPKDSVYTIIEFIYKRSATDFYKIVETQNNFFDEIFLLSGTILEHRRREIINTLKNKSNREKRILLITTQVVEAGVDIDMDIGFKDTSLIDSDEQLAGRINRNLNKKDCKLFLFNMNNQGVVYGEDMRYKLIREHINIEEHKRILEDKDFDYLYDMVVNKRNEWNNTKMTKGFNSYEQSIQGLRFDSVNKEFQLIENEALSCFIPLKIPIKITASTEGFTENFFTDEELLFLKENNVYENENKEIDGADVFDLYINIIQYTFDYSTKKVSLKILQSIMSKYVFSLFATPKIKQQIVEFSDIEKSKFGYEYIEHWRDFYDVSFGLDANMFNSNETQFL